MKLTSYLWNNIGQKRGRTIFYLVGIIISILSASTMQLLIGYYEELTHQFFEPYQDYDQIVEKGTNYFQFFPISSRIPQSLEETIEAKLQIDAIPSLYVSRKDAVFNIDVTFFIGMRIADVSILWGDLGLASGRWPASPYECVVGFDKYNGTQFEYYNSTFSVVGVISQQFSYLDKIFLTDLNTLQKLTGNENYVNNFYIPKIVEENPSLIEDFEAEFPNLDFLTQEELGEISVQVDQFSGRMAQVLIFFTALSAMVFIFSLNLLSIHNRKKDFDIFYILGAKKKRIVFLLWTENLILLLCGALIAIPLSFLTYGILFSYMATSAKNTTNYFEFFKLSYTRISRDFPTQDYFGTIGIITVINLLLTGVVMMIALRNYDIGKLKEKF